MKKPHLIGIAGASCSGKTTLASELCRELGDSATSLTLDSYYYDLAHLPASAIARHNLDEPAALDAELLQGHIHRLANGEPIDKPVYDHKSHARHAESERVIPRGFVVIEGLFALYWEAVRQNLATCVFINAAHDLCLQRRIERDRHDRGRVLKLVEERYRAMVQPMFDRYVLPTRAHADVIVKGDAPIKISIGEIITAIKRTPK